MTGHVLNALRHQRFGHDSPLFEPVFYRRCSTPYGIRGLVTQSTRRPVPPALSCSTPYGIRGLVTISKDTGDRRGSISAQRLTASEVWSRWAPTPAIAAATSAQRLTASEVWSHSWLAMMHATSLACSTPYGIRGLVTSAAALGQGLAGDVLNALRHQRFGHPLRQPCFFVPGFCAQRLTASEVWSLRRLKPLRDKRRNGTLQAS